MSVDLRNKIPQSVKEIWEETIVRFEQQTGQRLDGFVRSVDDLRKSINTLYDVHADDADVARAKEVGLQVINCIQLLGGIAAQGAQIAFGPAGICFNALFSLLDVPKKVHEFHAEVTAIFAEVGPALNRFRIYQRAEETTEIDEALRDCIHQVMTSFVDLCAFCINIHRESRWKSFKRNTKRVLLDDKSVKDQLDKFKQLTQNQSDIQATLTLEAALETRQYTVLTMSIAKQINATATETRAGVSELVDGERKRVTDGIRKDNISKIKSKLTQKDEQIKSNVDALHTMWQGSVKDSCQWLREVEAYNQWMDRTSTADSLLVITGPSGSGKSFLLSAIAREINLLPGPKRVLTGYHSFSVGAKDNTDKRRPETAIKSICVQMAEKDEAYAKSVAAVVSDNAKYDKFFRDADCKELWKELAIGRPAKNATHYLLLDSVNMLGDKEFKRLMQAVEEVAPASPEQGKSNGVRVLFCIDSTSPHGPELELRCTSARFLDITQHNSVDLATFVAGELENLFPGQDENSQRHKMESQTRILQRSTDNFSKVQQDLKKIKEAVDSSGTEEDLNQLLQESNPDTMTRLQNDIRALETKLKPREVEEINELLMWVVAGFDWFDLQELTSALFVRLKAVSLQPLAQKVTEKYSKIFALSPSGDSLYLQEGVKDCVVTKRVDARQPEDTPKINLTISITNADTYSVRRFFWDLSHHHSINGFDFSSESVLGPSQTKKIHINRVDAHFVIIQRAFELLTQSPVDERAKGMGDYFMAWMPEHLQELHQAQGNDKLLPSDKQYIASHIWDIFSDGDFIERNWEFRHRVQWYKEEKEMDIFWTWLDDPEATSHLTPKDKKWLARHSKGENRNQKLLAEIMTVVAHNWLQETIWEPLEAFEWITGFLNPVPSAPILAGPDVVQGEREVFIEERANDDAEPGNLENENEGDEGNEDGDRDKSEGDHSENGKGDEGDEGSEDSEGDEDSEDSEGHEGDGVDEDNYTIEMVLAAEEWCEYVLTPPQMDLVVKHERLYQTYMGINEQGAAFRECEKAVSLLEGQDPVNQKRLREFLHYMGNLSSSPDTALNYFEKAHQSAELDVDTLYALLIRYIQTGKEEKADFIIQKAMAERDPDTGQLLLIPILNLVIGNQAGTGMISVFDKISISILASPEQWSVLRNEWEAAIKNSQGEDLLFLHLYFAITINFVQQSHSEELDNGAAHLNECLTIIQKDIQNQGRYEVAQNRALTYLARYWFNKAIQASNISLEQCETNFQKLYETNRSNRDIAYMLGSFYTFSDHKNKARDCFRGTMENAFNILFDDDIGNDTEGFYDIFRVLNSTGDYENARRAVRLAPYWRFDEELLTSLFADEGPSFNPVTSHLSEFYHEKFQSGNLTHAQLSELLEEAKRVLTTIDPSANNEEMAAWSKACTILSRYIWIDEGNTESLFCDACNRGLRNDMGFHICKYCYGVDLCDDCYHDLKSGDSGRTFVCRSYHDWWYLEPWTTEHYVRAWNRLIPKVDEDGNEVLLTLSQWLGGVCEEWGLPKSNWNFE
ncbi:uncharacterized protein BDV14DRAFT_196251 [Aspergillus stella-maris]|uniref:uncharacterized protein n=1 Tax=Aspergillus stella-maris TaxID=1810926 RepID=UPI003CCD93D6